MPSERLLPRLDRPARRAAIGLTPLIDVVFILLLFFMLASNLQREQAFSLQLAAPKSRALLALAPEPPRAPAADQNHVARVDLAEGGEFRLDGQPIAAADLAPALSRRREQEQDLRVLLIPAAGVSLQQLVTVLDHLAAAGIAEVTLQ
jgi:biopolymer transport protein ExbD